MNIRKMCSTRGYASVTKFYNQKDLWESNIKLWCQHCNLTVPEIYANYSLECCCLKSGKIYSTKKYSWRSTACIMCGGGLFKQLPAALVLLLLLYKAQGHILCCLSLPWHHHACMGAHLLNACRTKCILQPHLFFFES